MIIRPYKWNDNSDLSGAKPGKGLRMNREQAEKLLAALIFDDLDETSKAELVAYLQTDDELRDRLADLRMAVKLADDAVNEGPDPVLGERRWKQLQRLAKGDKGKTRIFSMRRVLAVAAVLAFALVLVGSLAASLSRRRVLLWTPLVASKAPRSSSRAYSPPPASPDISVLRRRIDPTAQSYGRDAQPEGYAMGGMGGPARGRKDDYVAGVMVGGMGDNGQMLGKEVATASEAPDKSSSVRSGGEIVNRQVAASDEPWRWPETRDMGRASMPVAVSPRGGSVPQVQEREVAKEVNGDIAAREARLKEVLGQKSTVVETDEMKEQVSSLRGGRGNVTVEAPAKADGVINYGGAVTHEWSGTITPQKPAVQMVAPTPFDSALAFDKEVNQRLGINSSVKDNKSAPLLGDVPRVGRLFRKGVQPKANAEGPGQAIDGATAYADVPSVQVQKEPVPLATGLTDFLAEAKAEQNAPSLDKAKSNAPTSTEETVNLASSSHFKVVPVNPWVMTDRDAFSTFGLDVDTASYALCRRYIRGGFLPPVGAVRMEEFVNAFDYAYPQRDDATFAVHAEGAPSPFAPAGQDLVLLKVAVKARTVGRDQRRAANLIFVVDASASMGQADRLPLVQSVSNQLVDKLSEADRVSLVTCANEARLHLEAVSARQKDAIHQTINALQPAGPTNLLAGLKLGYEMARKSFVAGQTNQVVFCSDGVANIGQTEAEAMLKEVAEDRKQAITLTCVGVGYGAYNDAFLEALADQGDGRYVFLDSSEQAQEALVGQLAGSLQNVATDARIQVQFNPAQVRRYRLIGYENRDIEDQRFRDDTVEAGAVGSGQCSTALYELELTTSRVEGVPPSNRGLEGDPKRDESRLGTQARDTDEADLGTVFVRYRNTETGQIEEISRPLANSLVRRRSVENDPRFFLAAGAARFAEWLRQSEHARQTSLTDVQRLLDRVSAALPLDRQVQDLALLAHQGEGLPRAPEAPEGKP